MLFQASTSHQTKDHPEITGDNALTSEITGDNTIESHMDHVSSQEKAGNDSQLNNVLLALLHIPMIHVFIRITWFRIW